MPLIQRRLLQRYKLRYHLIACIDNGFANLFCRSLMFWFKSRKEEQKNLPQYQRDFDLSPQGDHYMFWEYLEVGKFFSHIYWFCFWRHSEDKVIVFVYLF